MFLYWIISIFYAILFILPKLFCVLYVCKCCFHRAVYTCFSGIQAQVIVGDDAPILFTVEFAVVPSAAVHLADQFSCLVFGGLLYASDPGKAVIHVCIDKDTD